VRRSKLASSALELLSHRWMRASRHRGDLVGAKTMQMEEHDYGPLLRGENAPHQIAYVVSLRLILRDRHLTLNEALVGCDCPAPAAQIHQDPIEGDAIEPSARVVDVLKVGARAPCGEKRLLEKVIGELPAVDELCDEARQFLFVLCD
jgi:hypothetical protein